MLALTVEATGVLIGGVAALTGIVALLLSLKRGQHQIHVLVNSQLTDVTNRVTQLEAALVAAGINVPPDPANTQGGTP